MIEEIKNKKYGKDACSPTIRVTKKMDKTMEHDKPRKDHFAISMAALSRGTEDNLLLNCSEKTDTRRTGIDNIEKQS